jgi:5-methylcytosine-specific restriction endonuclease McrA
MGKQHKKAVRAAFRAAVFTRDGHSCRVCGASDTELDAHHISDRTTMPSGGYVKENGISLCAPCHRLAEQLWETGVAAPGFSPEQFYALIGSSHAQALHAAEKVATSS